MNPSTISIMIRSNYKIIFGYFFQVMHIMKGKVMNAYLPYVVEGFNAKKDAGKITKLHTLVRSDAYKVRWS